MNDRKGAAEPRIFVLHGAEDLARAAAGWLSNIARERLAAERQARKKGPTWVHIALSGGSTPRRAYELLSSPPYRDLFPWDFVHFYQVDERWVPPEDPASNQWMLREALLGNAPAPPGNFHPIDTRLANPAVGARHYEEELGRLLPPAPASGFPRFDAILLGIGRDGHTASLFPGQTALAEETAAVKATVGGDPPLPRVTLTLPVLNAAWHVIFLVGGKDKAEAVRRTVLRENGDPPPAGRVSPKQGTLVYLLDQEAGSSLPERKGGGR